MQFNGIPYIYQSVVATKRHMIFICLCVIERFNVHLAYSNRLKAVMIHPENAGHKIFKSALRAFKGFFGPLIQREGIL